MEISAIVGRKIGMEFESIGRWWVSNNKNENLNCVCSAVLWVIWKLRNGLCFQGKTWPGMDPVVGAVARMLDGWRPLFKENKTSEMGCFIGALAQLCSKVAENRVEGQFKVGDFFLSAVPSGLRRSELGTSFSLQSHQDFDVATQERFAMWFCRLYRSLVLFLEA
jgi:hypothetical protein